MGCPTVVVMAKFPKLLFEGCENGLERIDGCLLGCMRISKLYSLLSSHGGNSVFG